MPDLFSLTSSALPADARVLAFRGAEAISTLYRFEIYVLIADPAFDMAAALGADTTLSINCEGGQPYVFHGILASLETVDELDTGALYRAVLVPRLWRLTLGHHNRVFVDESAPAILQIVLRDAGMAPDDAKLELTASYPPLPHVCQYRESRFAFLSRRMEREGIYYFFEQGDVRERLVVTDDGSSHQPLSNDPVRYTRVSGAGAVGVDGLRSFTCKHSAIVGSVEVRDHDYLRPGLPLAGQAKASEGPEAVQLYGENFLTPEEGARLARVRAEEIKARQVLFRGAGHALSLRPGYTFALEDHARFDGEYLVTELTHAGNDFGNLGDAAELLGLEGPEREGYHVELVAIPKSAQFRPERRTPVPRIYGTERAVVDGEAESDYAQLDEHGRYLVRIHFDESPGKDGKSSTRLRMMQPHGGSPESFHFPLRKGTEVMLTFEGGDPDRPVIAGVVPNLVNQTLVTSRNATKNIIMTGGGNRIIIEDQKGKEFIHLATPHKGTYLHLGSPFNPQYNKVTNTTGTSLSYTQDISTSVTGTDAQTVVEDARMTIIGRSQIQAKSPPAKEITALLGANFVANQFSNTDYDILYETILADCQKLAHDESTLEKLLGATPVDQNAILAIISVINSDLSTLAGDAVTYERAMAAQVNPLKPPMGFDITTWQSQIQAAISAVGTAKTAAGKTPPDNATVTAQEPAIKTPANSGPTAFPTNPKSTTAWNPNPNATPTYILLEHYKTHTTTLSASQPAPSSPTPTQPAELVDDYITKDLKLKLETTDATGMDPLSVTPGTSPPSLHPGSDVKVVGGDNATMIAHDARSHVTGRSYGLVLGGHASVVRNGQQSKVFAPAKSGPYATLFTPAPQVQDPITNAWETPWVYFEPLAYPLPELDPHSNIAQRSEVYGNQFTWVDGMKSSFVTQGVHTTVLKRGGGSPGDYQGGWVGEPGLPTPHTDRDVAQTTEVYGDQYSYVDGDANAHIHGTRITLIDSGSQSEIYAKVTVHNPVPIHTEDTTAQSTALHGDQYSWVDGNVNATITGDKTTHASRLESHCETSYKSTTIASLDLTTMKFALSVLNLAVTGITISESIVKVDNGVVLVNNKGFQIHN